MAVAFRKINPFRANQGDWTLYGPHIRSKWYYGGHEEMCDAPFIIGDITYKLLSLLAPGDKSFSQLVETVTAHFDHALSEIMESFKFNTRVQVNPSLNMFLNFIPLQRTAILVTLWKQCYVIDWFVV